MIRLVLVAAYESETEQRHHRHLASNDVAAVVFHAMASLEASTLAAADQLDLRP